jgi:hypothetical protein
MSVKVKVFLNGTNVRSGVSVQSDPPNIIGVIDSGEFDAIKQCAGGQADDNVRNLHNFWWVQLDTPFGPGWVNAIRIATGDNQHPIPHVPLAPTVNT